MPVFPIISFKPNTVLIFLFYYFRTLSHNIIYYDTFKQIIDLFFLNHGKFNSKDIDINRTYVELMGYLRGSDENISKCIPYQKFIIYILSIYNYYYECKFSNFYTINNRVKELKDRSDKVIEYKFLK